MHIKEDLAELAARHGLSGAPAGLHTSEVQTDGTLKHLVGLALGAPGSTKYHEAAHGLMRELDNMGSTGREIKRVLHQLAGTQWMKKQLAERLQGEAAALEQLKNPEEAVAHMFEQYMADPKGFKLRPKAEGIFQKIKDWAMRVAAILRTDERGKLIMDAFARGDFADKWDKPGQLRRDVLEVGTGRPVVKAAADLTQGVRDTFAKVSSAGTTWLKDTGLPAFNAIADAMHTEVGSEEDQKLSYLQAVERTHGQLTNKVFAASHGADSATMDEARRWLQSDSAERKALEALSPAAQEVVKAWRSIAHDVRSRFERAGVPLHDLGDDYFPVVFDPAKIEADRSGFLQMLEQQGLDESAAVGAFNNIVHGDAAVAGDDMMLPAFKNARERVLSKDIPASALRPYLSEDLNSVMQSYVRQASKKLEFSKRFGARGELLDNALTAARQQGATDAEVAQARQIVDGMLGNGGAIDPRWQKINGWAIAAANVSLLSLSFLSSMIDPLGVALRSGDMKEAWAGYQRGFKDIKKWIKEDPSLFTDEDRLAMLFGTVTVADNSASAVSDVSGGAKKVNDALFKWNLVEGWTRSQRVQSTLGAFRFIEKHLGSSDETSQRYMRELNLKPSDVQRTADGAIIRDPDNEALTDAVHRYVDSTVLRPNRAMRPAWANDPHFAVLWHLKSFSYAFDKVFNERALHEASFKNYKPLCVLGAFAPVSMASYWLKLMMTGGGELPAYAKAWDAVDWLSVSLERSGYGGIKGMWVGAATDPMYSAGPVVNMVAKAVGGGAARPQAVDMD